MTTHSYHLHKHVSQSMDVINLYHHMHISHFPPPHDRNDLTSTRRFHTTSPPNQIEATTLTLASLSILRGHNLPQHKHIIFFIFIIIIMIAISEYLRKTTTLLAATATTFYANTHTDRTEKHKIVDDGGQITEHSMIIPEVHH